MGHGGRALSETVVTTSGGGGGGGNGPIGAIGFGFGAGGQGGEGGTTTGGSSGGTTGNPTGGAAGGGNGPTTDGGTNGTELGTTGGTVGGGNGPVDGALIAQGAVDLGLTQEDADILGDAAEVLTDPDANEGQVAAAASIVGDILAQYWWAMLALVLLLGAAWYAWLAYRA